ncbi:tetratricopeptide repeat protein [Dehalococcoidia bacterium]|nr:tetratricopeptide repeat protein [Dehalococcoidia bacterium]
MAIQFEDKDRLRKDKAKKAVALAMNSQWEEAVALNLSITREFPQDIEALNRLGKALSELGRNREARQAFQSVIEISPNNSIAKKNLTRLERLADQDVPRVAKRITKSSRTFIEESGKAGVTSLINLASPEALLKLTPGDIVQTEINGNGLSIVDQSGQYVGKVEPRMATRLSRLIRGGNRYEATVTSVEQQELVIIIRETYVHPSQTNSAPFPARAGNDHRVYLPSTVFGNETVAEGADSLIVGLKDWSNDDTEPGDDEAFSPVIHRIINPSSSSSDGNEDF